MFKLFCIVVAVAVWMEYHQANGKLVSKLLTAITSIYLFTYLLTGIYFLIMIIIMMFIPKNSSPYTCSYIFSLT